MKPIEFIEGIRRSVVESNLKTYQDLFTNTKLTEATDPYFINALNFFNGLNTEQKKYSSLLSGKLRLIQSLSFWQY
jgi:hypothetical protein